LCLAQILAMDINRENYELGLPVIKKAGVDHKIEFREGPALPVLDEMVKDVSFLISYLPCPNCKMKKKHRLEEWKEGNWVVVIVCCEMQEKNHGSYDFIFVDADKDNYINYHKRLIELVKVGGLIGYDNTLWNGSVVAPPDAPLRKYVRYYRDFVLELNKALAADPRIEICMLPVGDGITLCRRIKWLLLMLLCFFFTTDDDDCLVIIELELMDLKEIYTFLLLSAKYLCLYLSLLFICNCQVTFLLFDVFPPIWFIVNPIIRKWCICWGEGDQELLFQIKNCQKIHFL